MEQLLHAVSNVRTLLLGISVLVSDRLRLAGDRERGQAVTEYTLVILVAASVALLLLNWVQGGALTSFFNDIFSQVTGMFAATP